MAQNERIIKNFEQFAKALDSLIETAQQELKNSVQNDLALKKAVRAGIIQCFEYTFEMLWKLLKVIADEELITANSPKAAFKAGFKLDLIQESEEEIFNEIIKKRNLTVHTYNEDTAQEVRNFIVNEAVKVFINIKNRINTYIYE